VVCKKRSAANSNIDRIGRLSVSSNNLHYSFIQVDLKKLQKYLLSHNILISGAFIKILGYHDEIK
jgi:hypothetical protein